MILPVAGVGEVGLVTDQPHHELPLNAWTAASNIRFRDGAAEKFFGHVEVFSGVLWSPEWLMAAQYGGLAFWLYASANKVGAVDGLNHADITRAVGGDYAMVPAIGWTGATIEDIPVINNGFDVPQQWKYPALATRLQDLENWPANYRANTIRVLKRYLVALDVTKDGTRMPNTIKWSSEAPTGGVPLSWDNEDETKDAGEWTLPGAGGFLVDAHPMRDVLILYKERQTWQMQFVGTAAGVFRFSRIFGNIGTLARRCAVEFFSGQHFVFTCEDAIVHDGQNARSVMSERARRMLQDTIDQANYNKSFVAVNYATSDVWACYPEVGQTYPTRALVWNWEKNRWGERELPKISFIDTGLVSPQSPTDTWDGATGTWETANRIWGDRASDPTKQKMLMASPTDTKLYLPEIGQSVAGQPMTAYVERQGIGWPLKSGQPPDYTTMKQVTAIWPRIIGTQGGVLNVYLGTQEKIGGPVSYGPAQAFVIGETEFCDFADSETARIHAVKFESNTDISWRLSGYDVDVIYRGKH